MEDLERLLGDLLESDASPGALHLVLSRLKDEGRLDLVIQQCRKALIAHPGHIGLRSLLAEACLNAGLASRASEELERVTAGLDEMSIAYRRLAEAYERQGRLAEAARCLGVYLAHRPADEEAREALERLQPEAEEAVPEPEAVPEAREEDTEDLEDDGSLPEIATPTLAEIYFAQGQIDAAIETYERILTDNPEDARAAERLDELRAMGAAVEEEPGIPEAPPEEFAEEPGLEAATEEQAPAEEPRPPEAAEEEGPSFEAEQEAQEPAMEPEAGAGIEEAPLEVFAEEQALEAAEEEAPAEEPGLPDEFAEEPGLEPATEEQAPAEEPGPPEADAEAFAEEQALEAADEGAPAEEPGLPEMPPTEPAVGADMDEAPPEDPAERKARRMIAILEEWLTRIHQAG